MEYFFIILPKLSSFLLLILIGVAAVKMGIVTKEKLPVLSGLLLKIVLPLLTIDLLCERSITFLDLLSFHRMILWQIGLYLLLAAAGILCTWMMRMKYPQSNVHRGCMVGGNYAFVVIPLIYALFDGTYGTQYIPICSTVDTVVVWTLGLTLFTWTKGNRGEASFKKLWNPIIGAVIVGLCINSFSIPVPEMVRATISQVGGTSASWGLIYMGCSLCFIEHIGMGNLKRILVLAAAKLLVVPLLIYALASHFLPETESIILMLIAAAPSMTTSVMIAKQYDLDEDYAAEAVSLTTIGCMVTVPVLFLCIAFL